MFNLDTLLRIPDVDITGGFSLSSDGDRLAFSWNQSGYYEIYQIDLKEPNRITKLSQASGNSVTPRYSPDGRYLAWAFDQDGSENFHIILLDLATGETCDLTADINYSIQPLFAWSPDGKRIAYLADKSGNYDLYVLSMDGSEDLLLFSPGGPAHFVCWSPAGSHIVVTAEKEWQADGTFVIPLEDGPICRVGGEQNPIDANQPAWSPDGTKLIFTSNSSGWSQVGIYTLKEDRIQWLTNDNSDKYNPTWSPNGLLIAWIQNNAETAWVKLITEYGATRLIQTESGFAYWPLFSMDGESIIFVYENPHQPPDLWQVLLSDGHIAQLTESCPQELKQSEFVIPEAVTFPSLDGTPIPALLYKPMGVSPRSPGVVLIHGGPAFHFGFYWYPLVTHLTSRGWTVICPNYRGSTGYGRDWLVSNRYEMGRLDSDDCAAAAIYLAKSDLANPLKIAVSGRSHGGYLTMTCLTRNPELFAVGSAVVPFLNWFTGHENSREDLQYWDRLNMGDPVENRELWRERSPFFFLDRVRSPVQFVCGGNDPRCPPSESIAAYNRLMELGIKSELLFYENEGHGFLKLENIIESENKRVEFMAGILEISSSLSPHS
jgi:dipeptidyl aminopeptidase/acylaminoacyl peptidase